MSAAGSRFAADHMPIWTPLQLEAERSFVDGWRRHGLDVDLASLTHPGQYHYVPEYLSAAAGRRCSAASPTCWERWACPACGGAGPVTPSSCRNTSPPRGPSGAPGPILS